MAYNDGAYIINYNNHFNQPINFIGTYKKKLHHITIIIYKLLQKHECHIRADN